MSPDTDNLSGRAKRLFDESVDELDAATLSRLNRGRQRALEKAGSRPLARWAPIGGLATTAAVALVVMQTPATLEPPAGSDATDFEILLGDDSLEMLEELEFYSWIDLASADGADDVG